MSEVFDFRGWDLGGGNTGTSFGVSEQYDTATLQILIGEGQIEGLVDGLKSVYLDGTPILNSDGSKNFKGVAVALVAGTNTQAAAKGIGGAESEVSVNVQVPKASPVTRSVTSNPSAIRVRIAIPALKVIGADGFSRGHSVTIKIERQNASYNGGAWQEVTLEDAGVISGGPFSSKFTRSFRVDLPASGTWQVRVTRVSNDDADAYHLSQTWWEAYTEIIDARLRYPNSAVLSLRVNANQFRSIPKVSLDLKLSRIQVPANYDPLTRAYATTGLGTTGGAWDGTFKEAWSDNPAWVFYDAATKTRYGAGSFLDTSALDKWTLYSIAQWCDTLVDDGKGGTEPRLTCNLYAQNQQNAIKAMGQLASIFWGVIYYASGLVVPVADADTAPVAVFNSSNVIDGKFTYEGTARSARHTAAVVKFTNPDLGWETDTAVYEDADGIARFGYNPLDINALGCTSHGQALRLARWSILTELLADETISFASGLEGSTVKPGDVVQVHDQFRAGNVRFGGRVASGATTTVIPLDAPVTFGAGTHYLKIKNASGVLETRTVTTPAGTVSSLTVSSAFSVAPPEGAVWLLQAGSTASLWRCLSIRKGDGITYDITALKHDPTKYVLLGLASGDVIPRSTGPRTSPAPAGLTATVVTRILNDKQVQTLEANWTLDGALGYQAEAALHLGAWQTMAVSGASAVLPNAQPGYWRVRVRGVWPSGLSPAATYQITYSQPEIIPPWIGTALGDAAAAAAAAAAAQADADTANTALANIASDSLLTPDEKPRVIQDRDVIAAEQAGIDAQATAYSITTEKTAYDTAVSALTTYLATLTSPVLWSDIAGNTTIAGATFRAKFSDVYTTRQALLNKIFERAKALADGAQGTANSASSAAIAAAQAAAYADTLARSSHNLIKNGNSEDANPTGVEAAGIFAGYPYSGTKCRRMLSAGVGAEWQPITGLIPVNEGEWILFEAMTAADAPASRMLAIDWFSAAGGWVDGTYTSQRPSDGDLWQPPSVCYRRQSVSGQAPTGAVWARLIMGIYCTSAGIPAQFDCLYACRKISAGMLEADIIRSSDYAEDGNGDPTAGFSAGIGQVAPIKCGPLGLQVGRAKLREENLVVNRISNGIFYSSLSPWVASGSPTPIYTATSRVSLTGGAQVSYSTDIIQNSTVSFNVTGSLSQVIKAPDPINNRPAVLKIWYRATRADTGGNTSDSRSYTGTISAYLTNLTTGAAESMAGSAACTVDGTWRQAAIPVTSSLPTAGDYLLRLALAITGTNTNSGSDFTPGQISLTLVVDEIDLSI